MSAKKSCADCGADPVNHYYEYWSVFFAWLFRPYTKLMDVLWRNLCKIFPFLTIERLSGVFIRLLVLLRIGKFVTEPGAADGSRSKVIWEAARARGITMRELYLGGKPTSMFIASYHKQTKTFEGLPRPGDELSSSISWMDNKTIMKREFLKAGIPVARGGTAFTFMTAKKIFNRIGAPVITKPNIGSRSRHTTLHIETGADLERGFKLAKQLSPWVIIESQLEGTLYRATVVSGKVAAVLRRDPAGVTGDGKHTIRQLIEIENANPLRHGPIFHELAMNADSEDELRRQHLVWDSTPPKGAFISLGTKTSRGAGGGTYDVTGKVHADNIAVFEKVAATLNDPLIGIDFIITDISKSWKTQNNCGVIECNSLPFIDLHHYPLGGNAIDVASILWDAVFPESKTA